MPKQSKKFKKINGKKVTKIVKYGEKVQKC